VICSLDLRSLPTPSSGGAVISIGVFDGVHLGHQAILSANVARAQRMGARATVVTFAGHPKKLLLGREPRTLTSLEHRLELFRRAGIEHTLALTFDESLRRISAEEFVDSILVERMGARAFVLGFDSKFGRDKRGGPELLLSLGHIVDVIEQVLVSGRAVSSTAIREAVELGDLAGAQRMLGRAVSVLGTVVEGAQLGRELGFPTANLDLHHELHPPAGVYAGRARVLGAQEEHAAVANIGVRPTLLASEERLQVEVHLLDFQGDLYGRQLEFQFATRLRAEQRFEGREALSRQIALDVQKAREFLAQWSA
jgi:riboflavin kinase/FMN adenylyltransferase